MKHWSLLKITGVHAENFLQGQLTCDVRKITEKKSGLGALCNHQGRILAIILLFKRDNDFYCFLPQCLSQEFRLHLNKFAVFSKVLLEDVTSQFFRYDVVGEKNIELLKEFSSQLPTRYFEISQKEEVIICAFPGKEPRYIIWGPLNKQSLLPPHFDSNSEDYDLWKKISILSGIPTIFSATRAMLTPHMLNLHLLDAVSLDKGCYCGQEIIARTHYLGKSKRLLYLATFPSLSELQPGEKLFANDEEVGVIIDSVADKNETLLLAVLQESALKQKITCKELPVENIHQSVPFNYD